MSMNSLEKRKKMKKVLGVVLTVLSMAGTAGADQVHLKNGQVLDGIIVREGDEEVVLEIAWESYVILDRASVLKIEMAENPERKAMLDHWRETYETFKTREERERVFEESQRAKGLVLYRGDWVTKEELALIKAKVESTEAERAKREAAEQSLKREEEARKKLEMELSGVTDRLRSLQEEQIRLQQEIASLRGLLARRRARWPVPRRLPRAVRDPQGNVLRVVTDASGTLVELADGNRCELAFDGASYNYVDASGAVHVVQPVE